MVENKKLVIACSSKFEKEIEDWKNYFEKQGYQVINYPKKIDQENEKVYKEVYLKFFKSLDETDILFVLNGEKNGIEGYIGAETFAELTFALMQNLVYNKNIQIVILRMPSINVQSYEEINLWLKLGWIKLLENIYELKE